MSFRDSLSLSTVIDELLYTHIVSFLLNKSLLSSPGKSGDNRYSPEWEFTNTFVKFYSFLVTVVLYHNHTPQLSQTVKTFQNTIHFFLFRYLLAIHRFIISWYFPYIVLITFNFFKLVIYSRFDYEVLSRLSLFLVLFLDLRRKNKTYKLRLGVCVCVCVCVQFWNPLTFSKIVIRLIRNFGYI